MSNISLPTCSFFPQIYSCANGGGVSTLLNYPCSEGAFPINPGITILRGFSPGCQFEHFAGNHLVWLVP